MVNITIIGAGVHGTRIANKYKKFKNAKLKTVISRGKPKDAIFFDVPFFSSAIGWEKNFGKPDKRDVFDISVHQDSIIAVMEDFIKIGAKNFVLPKPIAITKKELSQIQYLAHHHKLKILVASQWHYSKLVEEVTSFVKKNKSKISSVDVVFSRSFKSPRKESYTATTAFLPHILQILFDTKLIKGKSNFVVENSSDNSIALRYVGKKNIHIVSNITDVKKTEIVKIFLNGDDKPALVANFSGILGSGGFVKYPSITIAKKEHQVREDVLEKMISSSLKYFSGNGSDNNILTLHRYLPIAKEEIRIVEHASKLVVVIGGGIFGILSALEIAKKGYSVVVFEKASEIITGASLVNQCRVHMGYHYPRDEKTARESRRTNAIFERFFDKAIVKDLNNYYLIAKHGSLTNPEDFHQFCRKLRLPYKKSWPVEANLSKEKISLSAKVPEKIFDANVIRDILNKKIAMTPNMTLLTKTEVVGIKKNSDGFNIIYKTGKVQKTVNCGAIINAAYGNINHINSLFGLPLNTYQYELCEMPVVKTPWSKEGWSVIDGPFFGVMPFGFSKKYLFYDVELSVLERVVGEAPNFKFDIPYYNDEKRRMRRFDNYKKKWAPYLEDIEKCQPISSLYVTRVVLPKKEKTDARPTIINEVFPGFWQIFSGKVTTSVPRAIELGISVGKFFKRKK
ncbi:hypothetical protein COB55_00170 [Candidatus Wolfebacteria bacterium]|nr:MAG: hypothetical protein COB55_00170 [Candidatus Wolfebacteria bacterium]